MKGGLVRVSLRAGLWGAAEALTKRRPNSQSYHFEFSTKDLLKTHNIS